MIPQDPIGILRSKIDTERSTLWLGSEATADDQNLARYRRDYLRYMEGALGLVDGVATNTLPSMRDCHGYVDDHKAAVALQEYRWDIMTARKDISQCPDSEKARPHVQRADAIYSEFCSLAYSRYCGLSAGDTVSQKDAKEFMGLSNHSEFTSHDLACHSPHSADDPTARNFSGKSTIVT
jgi:hypothetical protein